MDATGEYIHRKCCGRFPFTVTTDLRFLGLTTSHRLLHVGAGTSHCISSKPATKVFIAKSWQPSLLTRICSREGLFRDGTRWCKWLLLSYYLLAKSQFPLQKEKKNSFYAHIITSPQHATHHSLLTMTDLILKNECDMDVLGIIKMLTRRSWVEIQTPSQCLYRWSSDLHKKKSLDRDLAFWPCNPYLVVNKLWKCSGGTNRNWVFWEPYVNLVILLWCAGLGIVQWTREAKLVCTYN